MIINSYDTQLTNVSASKVLGDAREIHGNSIISSLLRAIIVNRTEYDLDSLKSKSFIGYCRVDSDDVMRNIVNSPVYDVYQVLVAETRVGYFPSDFSEEGWVALDDAPYPVSKYLSQIVKTRVFVNETKERVVAVVEKIATNTWMQAFASTFPRVLKWYFTSELSSDEQQFYKTISVGNKEVSEESAKQAFLEYVNAAAQKIDFRSLTLHSLLDNYSERARERAINDKRSTVDSILRTIRSYQNGMREQYERLTNEQRLLKSLESMEKENSSEVFDFFNQHKCIDVISVNGDEIRFGVTETLEFYDEDEFRSVFNRKSSYIYSSSGLTDTPRVLNAIFAEHKGVFVVNAVFSLTGMGYIDMHSDLSDDTVMPHPHIYFFQCSGGNDQYYSKYADEGEWQLAVEQAIGATKNLNFGDSTVVSKMIRWLEQHKSTKCIKLTDSGKMVSMNEFVKMLNEGDQNNG